MKTHHVVNTKQLRISKMISQIRDDVLKSIQPHRFRIHWRESPVLTFREDRIRRCAACDAFNEEFAIAPDVIAVHVQAEWKIQIEELASRLRPFGNRSKLLLNDPL